MGIINHAPAPRECVPPTNVFLYLCIVFSVFLHHAPFLSPSFGDWLGLVVAASTAITQSRWLDGKPWVDSLAALLMRSLQALDVTRCRAFLPSRSPSKTFVVRGLLEHCMSGTLNGSRSQSMPSSGGSLEHSLSPAQRKVLHGQIARPNQQKNLYSFF